MRKNNRTARNSRLVAAMEGMELRRLLSTVTGTVFDDIYPDGLRSFGEIGLSGRTVYADYNYNGAMDADEPRAQTNSGGDYSLAVRPEHVDLRVVINPGEEVSLGYGATSIWVPVVNGTVSGKNFPLVLPPPINPIVTGTVFLDSNGNGLFDAEETGLADRVVYVDLNNDGQYQTWPIENFGTTRQDGSYTINAYQQPYNVTLRVVLESGEVSSGVFVSNAGQGISGQNIPVRIVSSIVTGKIFADANRNRQIDAGEAGLAARTVYADYNYNGTLDAGEPSTLTDANGNYSLATRSQYVQLSLVINPGEQTTLGNGGNSIWIPLVNGATSGINIGIVSASTTNQITGTIYADTNRNGQLDSGEAGLSNRTVFADYNYNGVLDGSEPSALTDSNGNFVLATRAQYVDLRVITNAGEQITSATSLWIPAVSGTVAGKNFGIAPTAPTSGEVQLNYYLDANHNGVRDAGERLRQIAALWDDLNRNSRLDPGEPSYDVTQPMPSDAYKFALSFGDHRIAYQVATFGIVYTTYLWDATLSVLEPVKLITHAAWNDESTAIAAAFVYADSNRNGNQNEGEPDVAGQRVFADYNNNGILDAGEPTSQTDDTGYAWIEVTRPTFSMRLITSGEYVQFTPGGNGAIDYTFTENFGFMQVGTFGVVSVPTAFVTGTVFSDTNRNGRIDAGEIGLAARTVFADYNYNGVLDVAEPSAVTDASGNYSLGTRSQNVQLSLVTLPGEQITLGYGATSIWLPTVNGTMSGKNFGLANALDVMTQTRFMAHSREASFTWRDLIESD